MINNRQAGRRRGRGGNNNGGGNGNGPRQGGGQRDNGNRIDSRARGNANQLYEKYKNLAADSQRQGDRVNTEYYLQFADHYFRVLSETRNRFEEQNQRRQRDDGGYEAQPFTGSFDSGFDQDDDYADEGEPIRPGEQAFAEDRGTPRGDQQRGDQQRGAGDDRGEPRAMRNDRQPGEANGQPRRDTRPRDDRPRDDRPRDERPRDDRFREDRPRGEQRRDAQPREDAAPAASPDHDVAPRENGEDQARRARRSREDSPVPMSAERLVEAPVAADEATVSGDAPAEAPRRRGRPRRERPADEAPAAFDATLLPPSLGIAPVATAVEAEGEAEEKPRRRRIRATPPAEATSAS